MNRCRFRKELSSYLDSQLSEKRKIQIEGHLRSCTLCIQELEKLRALSEKLKSWQAPILDASFDSSVRNKIVALELGKERVKMNKKTLSILIPSAAVAGILLVSLLSLNVYMQRGVGGGLKSDANDANYIGAQREPYSPQSAVDNIHQKESNVERKREFAKGMSEQRSVGVRGSDYFAGRTPLAPAFSEVSKIDATEAVSSQGDGFRVIVIQPTLPATGIGDMIIRTAELTLEVENGKETYRKITDICREFGGYQAESSFSENNQRSESGRVTLRIPKDKFLAALDKLSELGKVKANNTYSQDVSQDYANLKAELDAAMVVYNKMLEALQKRQTSISEAVRLESELTPVLKKIENLKNQVERLNNLTSFTTISVNFYEAEVSAKVLEESKKLVKESILAAKINAVRYFAAHLPLVGLVAGFTIVVFTFAILLSIFITRLKKRS